LNKNIKYKLKENNTLLCFISSNSSISPETIEHAH
jgi:hypothetical protein